MMVILEYSNMMQKILEYMSESTEKQFQAGKGQLIETLNNKYFSVVYLCLIHAVMMTLNFNLIAMLQSMIGIFLVFVKLYSYCQFMQSEDKKIQELAKNDNFVRQALTITFLSILMEIFGQIFISGFTALGYLYYFQQPKFIAITFCLSWQADNGGLFFGNAFGSKPFAQSISPKKTTEGIIGAFVLCFLSALLMWVIAHHWSDFLYVKITLADYAILGAVNGLLAIMSDLVESFMKRCANVKDSGTFFPGHGGFFDRLDSILLPLPFTYWYMTQYLSYTFNATLQ